LLLKQGKLLQSGKFLDGLTEETMFFVV